MDRYPSGIMGGTLAGLPQKYSQYPPGHESHWSLWGKHCPLNANTARRPTVAGAGPHMLPGFVRAGPQQAYKCAHVSLSLPPGGSS